MKRKVFSIALFFLIISIIIILNFKGIYSSFSDEKENIHYNNYNINNNDNGLIFVGPENYNETKENIEIIIPTFFNYYNISLFILDHLNGTMTNKTITNEKIYIDSDIGRFIIDYIGNEITSYSFIRLSHK